MNIAFTGHRDRETYESELDKIHSEYPNAKWIHGDCKTGFDAQVKRYCEKHGIPMEAIPPHPEHIKVFGYKKALLMRDEEVVCKGERLYCCYDGRVGGGTYYTMNYARKCGKQIVPVPCVGSK